MSSIATVRSNSLIALGDLIVRFPNLIEPWTKNIYERYSTIIITLITHCTTSIGNYNTICVARMLSLCMYMYMYMYMYI